MRWEVRTMRFATSCSKTLIRSDWRRFWPVGFLYALISFFMLPLPLWVGGQNWQGGLSAGRDAFLAEQVWGSLPGFVILTSFFGAAVAMAVYSYLMAGKSVGLMHALPVSRGRQFFSHFAAGLSMLTAANCLTFLDKLNDYDMRLMADYGIEGISYDLNEDGNIVMREIATENMPQLGLHQMVTYTPLDMSFPVEKNERDLALTECYEERTRAAAITNPAIGYMASSKVYSDYGSDLDEIISTARTQYICGTIDEAGLQAAWDDWADRGGNDLIDEINELYQADLAASGEAESETAAE